MVFYKKPWAVASLIAFIITSLAIFFFSFQSGTESGEFSKVFYALLDGLNLNEQSTDIDVEKVDITAITLSAPRDYYYVGTTVKLTVKLMPENATEKYSFSSSDENIATVTSKGEVSFYSVGDALITATSESGNAEFSLPLSVYPSGLDGLDRDKLSVQIADVLDVNYCAQVKVLYDGKPVNIRYKLSSSDTQVFSTNGAFVLTHAKGAATLKMTVEEQEVFSKDITVDGKVYEYPQNFNATFNGEKVGENFTFYLGKNYSFGFSADNESDCCQSFRLRLENDCLTALYVDDAKQINVSAQECGKCLVRVYSTMDFTQPLVTFTANVIPPKAVVTGLTVPAYGFNCSGPYELTLSVNDKYSLVGYTYKIDGNDYHFDENNYVVFDRVGNFNVTFTSEYYPEDSYTFTLVVVDDKKELRMRKEFGHFGLFALLALFGTVAFLFFIRKKPLNYVVITIAGLIVAVLSELFQLSLFTSGRAFQFTDILIDMAGYAVGIGLTVLALFTFYKVRRKRRTSSPTVK